MIVIGRRGAAVVALMMAAGCKDRRPREAPPPPAPAPRFDRAPAKAPTPAVAKRTIGRGPAIYYPDQLPLHLAAGVAVLEPPMRVLKLRAVPGRPEAVASGTSAQRLVVALVDIGGGVIEWRNTTDCPGPAVHVTAERVVCAGARNITGLDRRRGLVVWREPMAFRAADGDVVFAHDPADPAAGVMIDAMTGARTTIAAPAGESFAELHEICTGTAEVDLYAWSNVGRFRHLRVSRSGEQSTAELLWSRALGRAPAEVDLCDQTLLIEVPIPGSRSRMVVPLAAATGEEAGAPVELFGFWRARNGAGVETAGEAGIQLRKRDLTLVRQLIGEPIGSRLVAEWRDNRLLRAVAGTLVLYRGDDSFTWLASPAVARNVVMTSRRLLAGAWLAPPQTIADHLALYQLPEVGAEPRQAPIAPPEPSSDSQFVGYQLPEPPAPAASRVVSNPGAGAHGVSDVTLAGDQLYMATLERRPRPDYGAGLARFDLAAREWRWHRDQICIPNAAVIGVAVAGDIVVCAASQQGYGGGGVTAVDRATGEPRWSLELPTVDTVAAAGEAVVATYGSRAAIITAADGVIRYELEADHRHTPRVVPVVAEIDGKERTLVVAVEPGGIIVAREVATGEPIWAVATRGYLLDLQLAGQELAASFATGELRLLAAADGADRAIGGWSATWRIPGGGDLFFADTRADPEVTLMRGFGSDGRQLFFNGYAIDGQLQVELLRDDAPRSPVMLTTYYKAPRVVAIDPREGKVSGVHLLPPNHVQGGVFSASVDTVPVTGVVLQKPAAIQFF